MWQPKGRHDKKGDKRILANRSLTLFLLSGAHVIAPSPPPPSLGSAIGLLLYAIAYLKINI